MYPACNHRFPGALAPSVKTMPVPTHPWQYIGIDFVGPLPESSNRNGAYDMICVVIDLLTAMVHLVPTRQTYTATDMAEVIFDTVYKLHGLPERIISDRDSLHWGQGGLETGDYMLGTFRAHVHLSHNVTGG